MRSIYIAGPMRGIKMYNFPAFDAARDRLIPDWDVVSPADIDRSADGFDPVQLPEDHDWDQFPAAIDQADCIDRDIAGVRSCDAIYMLRGWERSVGARAELAVAQWMGKETLFET